jgi:hypothetical protein
MSDFAPTTVLDTPVTALTTAAIQGAASITVKAKKGTFVVSVEGDETGDVKFNATKEELLAALEDLGAVDSGDFVVTGGPGDELGTKPYVITAAADGQYAGANFPTFTTDAAKLEEGAHTAAVATVTTGVDEGDNPDAVQRGTGNADRTKDVSPLTGVSPAEDRVENGEDYGDE